jgi:hypothetical protein
MDFVRDFSVGLHDWSHPFLAEDTSLQAALKHATPQAAASGEIQWGSWDKVLPPATRTRSVGVN